MPGRGIHRSEGRLEGVRPLPSLPRYRLPLALGFPVFPYFSIHTFMNTGKMGTEKFFTYVWYG